jgi:hypothetical protein
VPPGQVAIIRLLNFAKSFRWDVINPLHDFVERHEERMRAGDKQILQEFNNEYSDYRRKLDRMAEQSQRYNYQDLNYIEAALSFQNQDTIEQIWKKSYLVSDSISRAVAEMNIDKLKDGLKEFQRLNKIFMILCLDKYLEEAGKLRPRDLTIDLARAEICAPRSA